MFIHRGWDLDVRVYQPCVLRAYYVRTTLLVAVSCLYDADPVPSSTQCQSRLRGEQEATCVQLRNLPAVYRYIGCCSGHSWGSAECAYRNKWMLGVTVNAFYTLPDGGSSICLLRSLHTAGQPEQPSTVAAGQSANASSCRHLVPLHELTGHLS